MHQHYWSSVFSETTTAVWGRVNKTQFRRTHVWRWVSVFGLSLSWFSFLFTKARRKDNEELAYFTDLSEEGSEQITELSCHISNKAISILRIHLCIFYVDFIWIFYITFPSLLLSHSILSFPYPTPTLMTLHLFSALQSFSFSLLHGCWLIIGGQLLR